MFERYTEKARRTIFFARYEASQFGSPYIETEHLLLGLLREDKALASRFLTSAAAVEAIRVQIEAHSTVERKVSTSVDLPLSHEAKRVLAYGSEEAKWLKHKHIGTEHLLLGMLREDRSFAAQLLRERGVTLESVREKLKLPDSSMAQGETPIHARLEEWFAENENRRDISIAGQQRVGYRTAQFAIFAADQPKREDTAPAAEMAQIQKRLDFLVERIENAIANHEFEKARFFSDDERKEREKLRELCEKFHLDPPKPRAPLLCIEIIQGEKFHDVLERCDAFLAEGVAQVWLLEPDLKRAYTVNTADGLREFKGEVLKAESPSVEIDLKSLFG